MKTLFQSYKNQLYTTIRKLSQNIKYFFRTRISKNTPKSFNVQDRDEVEGMGVDLIKYIADADAQVAGAHDIKIKLKSNLHRHLTNKGLSINKNNLGIKLSIPTENSNITVNALVYPKIIQLDIGCTKETYSDDDTGRRQLASLLGYIWKYLCEYSGHQADIPAPQEWILTHYHYGKDGKMEYDGEKFHITAFNALGEFIRAYSKRRLDGSIIVRIEEVRTKKITIGAFLRKGGASRK